MKVFNYCFFFLIFNTSLSIAQASIENLVFEGAGIRGIAYSGVIKVLENEHQMNSIKRVGGTSAGAITAMAISLGYTSEELATLISGTDFSKFNDGTMFFIGGLHRLHKRYGWYKGQRFLKWMEALQFAKTGIHDMTFQQAKDKGLKELYITGTSLTRQKLIVFSAETYPMMRISDAIRISMSIPLYFQAVAIDSNGKIVKHTHHAVDIMVDGGVLSNFPITMFDTIKEINGQQVRIINPHTLGVRIDSDEQIQADQSNKRLVDYPINSIKDYTGAFYTILLESLNRKELTKEDWDRTVSVSSQQIGPQLKRLSEAQKSMLINSGEVSLRTYYNKKEIQLKN